MRQKLYRFLFAAFLTNATTIFAAFCSLHFVKGQAVREALDNLILGVFYWSLQMTFLHFVQVFVYDKILNTWQKKGKVISESFKRVIIAWTVISFFSSIYFQNFHIESFFIFNLYIFAPLMWYLILTPRKVLQPQF
ncbi:MAG: hypothetical protein V4642_00320 [Bacteroidota bacterium]